MPNSYFLYSVSNIIEYKKCVILKSNFATGKWMRLSLVSAICLLGLIFPSPASAQIPFEQAFRHLVQDQALDAHDFLFLQRLASQPGQSSENQALAEHLLGFLKQHKSFVQITYRYYLQDELKEVRFAFAPTYAENQELSESTGFYLLGQIAQRDILNETVADAYRCSAAAILAGYYLLNGSFRGALNKLNLGKEPLTYRTLHLAQEFLYQRFEKDGIPGMSEEIRYQVNKQGQVKIIDHGGEVKEAAAFLGLALVPLKITERHDLLDRQAVILKLWQESPQVPLLVGVYLDQKSGDILPPDEKERIQNHSVLVFRRAPHVWLYNSGVSNNGNGSALRSLDAEAVRRFVTQTAGTVNILKKQ